MSEPEELNSIKAYLAARDAIPSPEAFGAWEDFFQAYEPVIRNVIKKCTNDPRDLEDLVQEAWSTLVEKLPELEFDPDRGPLRAWTIVVVRRAAIREARRLARKRADELTPELAGILLDPAMDPLTRCVREHERGWVRSSLATLGAKLLGLSHQVLLLYWIDELSVPEIAAKVGRSEDGVRMRLSRALRKLRDLPGASKSK